MVAMNEWVEKDGYATCLRGAADIMNQKGTEVSLVRFRRGKSKHYHKYTTEFFYFTSGKGKALIDGEEIRISPGTSIVVQPHQHHTFMNTSTNGCLEAVLVKTNQRPADTFYSE